MAIDVSTFNFYFKKLYAELCFLSIGIVKDKEKAEDIVQDAYVALYTRMERTDLWSIKSFLTITVMNKSWNIHRHQKVIYKHQEETKLSGIIVDDRHVLDRLIQTEVISQIMQEIEKLPSVRKKVFKMSWIDEMSNPEIAKELGICKFTVREHKWRALKQLRAIFSNLKIPDNGVD